MKYLILFMLTLISIQLVSQNKLEKLFPSSIKDKYTDVDFVDEKYAIVFKGKLSRYGHHKKGKYGIVDSNGDEKVSCKFDYINLNHQDSVFLVYNGKTGKFNLPNKYNPNGKFSFLNLADTLDLNFIYDNVYNWKRDVCIVKLNDECVVLDSNGNVYIQDNYNYIWLIHGKNYCVRKEGEYFFINDKGEKINSQKYEGLYFFDDGYMAFKRNELWGFLDSNFKEVIEAKYDNIDFYKPYNFLNYKAIEVKKNNKSGIINMSDSIIVPFIYDDIIEYYKTNFLKVVEFSKNVGVLDSSNKMVVAFKKDDCIKIIDNRTVLLYRNFVIRKREYKRKKALYDVVKNKIIKDNLRLVFVTGENTVAFLTHKKKWGFYDLVSRDIIEPKYSNINRDGFIDGHATVMLGNKWVKIDKKGNIIGNMD